LSGVGLEKYDREARLTTLEFPEFNLVAAYLMCGYPQPKRTIEKIEYEAIVGKFLKSLPKKPTIMAADFNCNPRRMDWHKAAFNFLKENSLNSFPPGCSPQEQVSRLNMIKSFSGVDVWEYLYPDSLTHMTQFQIPNKSLLHGQRLDQIVCTSTMLDLSSPIKVIGMENMQHVAGKKGMSDHTMVIVYLSIKRLGRTRPHRGRSMRKTITLNMM
jgi:exonuclease III